jgi:glycosyltransferase involved in cell wall biosynthesis
MSLPRYDLVLAVSDRMSVEVARTCPNARVDVLPSGIDLNQFQPLPREEARAQLGIVDEAPWVLFAQPSRPTKRFSLANDAIALARNRVPTLKLQCIEGRAPSEIPLWINASDVVLLTSTHEGWPNIIKEALACGVPFVSTDVSDLRRIAELEPACRVAQQTPESLASGVLESLAHGRHTRLRRHAESFGLDATADRLIALYRGLLPAHKREREVEAHVSGARS